MRAASGAGRHQGGHVELDGQAIQRLYQRAWNGNAVAQVVGTTGMTLFARQPDALDPGDTFAGANVADQHVDLLLEMRHIAEGGRVDVRASIVDGIAEISVTDTGVGIAPEDHEAIFEEFRQVGTSDKKVEGTGLGLALSRKFIELHGGVVRAIS